MAKGIYTVGGAVQADQGIYITRRADDELFSLCRSGTFAYVLTARQMGKSSLMVSTAERLGEVGIRSVIIDLEKFGTQTTAEAWYLDLLDEIAEQLDLSADVVAWWQARSHLGMAHRLVDFFLEVLLAEIAAPVIVFVDEIDTTLSLPFADDFYAAIRALYEARARTAALKRLSFVLIGVATPGDLIRDSKRTPFNIGQRVDLTDFSFEEALPFADGFGLSSKHAQRLLSWALHWTNGYPYLTQRLCRTLATQSRPHWSKREVEQLVATTFFGEKSQQDNNLQFVRDMLTRRAPDRTAVLSTYRDISRGRRAVLDEEQSTTKNHLELAGVARREGHALRVRNAIYQTVFDDRWIKEHLSTTWPQRLRRVRRVAISIIIPLFILSVVLAGYAWSLASDANAQRQSAVAAKATAEIAAIQAIDARQTSEARRVDAEAARATAEIAQVTATVAQGRAEVSRNGAVARQLDFAANSALDPEVGLLLSMEAAKRDWDNPEIQQTLQRRIRDSHIKAVLPKQPDEVTSATFSPDGKHIVTASRDNVARIWDYPQTIGTPSITLAGHTQRIWSVAYSLDGSQIVTASEDGTARVWEARKNGEPIVQVRHTQSVYSAEFSADGERIVTASHDGTARIWNARSGTLEFVLTGHAGIVFSAAFSPDGAYVVTAGKDKTTRTWDARTGKQIAVFQHPDWVQYASFSPDGTRIVTAGADRIARVWSATGTGAPLELRGHLQAINNASWSPDGRYIVTASNDKSARVWDSNSGELLLQLIGHTERVWSASFSPNGQMIVTASKDGTARIWEAQRSSDAEHPPSSLDSLLSVACHHVTRDLNPDERKQFGLPITPTPVPDDTSPANVPTPIC